MDEDAFFILSIYPNLTRMMKKLPKLSYMKTYDRAFSLTFRFSLVKPTSLCKYLQYRSIKYTTQ